MEREMESIQHFSHKHPLIFSGETNGDGKEILCKGCLRKISGSSYSCKDCSFFLHKFCANLPKELKHHMHPKPLRLLQRSPKPKIRSDCSPNPLLACTPLRRRFPKFGCDACGKYLKGFTYHCSQCDFYLDTFCASRALSIEHKSHQHPLIPQINPVSFECSACRTKAEDVSYQCSTCGFWIHQDCASLSPTIKHSGHVHPLTLSYAGDKSTWWYKCKVCFRVSGMEGWFYSCRGCQYVVHVKCYLLTKNKESKLEVEVWDINRSNSIHLPMRGELVRLIDLFVKQISLGDNKEEAELNHFSHNHPLTFFNVPKNDDLCHGNEQYRLNEENKDKICSACDQTISASFYGCRPCNFFIHKWCANLPDELKHRLHPHPLMLRKEIYEPGRKFFCQICVDHCKGFRFQCVNSECGYSYCLDVKCTCLPSSILHEIHEHPLLLKGDCRIEGCAACDRRSSIASFGCVTCNFSLHYKCALLPFTFTHRYDEHPFILNYGPIKDGPDEYICEFCEDEIDPKWWFYHCIDCDQSACAECILKDGKYIEKSIWKHHLIKSYPKAKMTPRAHCS